MIETGWVKIHRSLINSERWTKEPFTRCQAWIDLIALANHKTGYIRVAGERVEILRGQCGWSIVKLCSRWKWGRKKVRNFLKELQQKDHQIEMIGTNRTSIISIVNYEQYQGEGAISIHKKGPPEGPSEGLTEGHQKAIRRHTNKKVKNNKNEKNENKKDNNGLLSKENIPIKKQTSKIKFSEFVEVTQNEYDKLVDEVGDVFARKCIDRLDKYIPNKPGRPYRDHMRAIRSWVISAVHKDPLTINGRPVVGFKANQTLKLLERVREEESRSVPNVIMVKKEVNNE